MTIDFSFDTPYGRFSDALRFDDSKLPTDAEIETMKQTRLNNWIAALTAPAEELPIEVQV